MNSAISIDREFRRSAVGASREMIKRKGLSNYAVEAAFIKLFVTTKTHAVCQL